MRVGHLLTAFSVDRLRERGLIGFSGFMAAICGLAALGIGIWLIALAALLITIESGHLPAGKWSWGRPDSLYFTSETRTWVAPPVSSYRIETVCTWTPSTPKTCHTTRTLLRPEDIKPDPIANLIVWLTYLAYFVPWLALGFGFVQASACFVNLARKRYFDRQTIRRLRNFALCGLVFTLLFPNTALVSDLIRDLVDAIQNGLGPKGTIVHHMPATISASGTDAVNLVLGMLPVVYVLTLTVIAAVMTKAASIAEDHAQIV